MIGNSVDRGGEAWRATMQGLTAYHREMAERDEQRDAAADDSQPPTETQPAAEERAQ